MENEEQIKVEYKKAKENLKRYKNSETGFEDFCQECVFVVDKSGDFIPFKLKPTQKAIIKAVQKQYDERGFVRLGVVKSRQIGCSTLFSAYFLYRSILKSNVATIVMAHVAHVSKNIASNINKMYQGLPPFVQAECQIIAKDKERFTFSNGSNYVIGTAGGEDIRGYTFQQVLFSECAYYTSKQIQGLLEAIARNKTMIIFESTPNGMNNLLYDVYRSSKQKDSDTVMFFSPWWDEEEYKIEKEEYSFTDVALKYRQTYNPNLTDAQLAFWDAKYILKGDEQSMNNEYPPTIEVAFMQSGDNTVFKNDVIARCMNRNKSHQNYWDYQVKIGFDVAGYGDDNSAIAVRCGKELLSLSEYSKLSQDDLFDKIKSVVTEYAIFASKNKTDIKLYVDSTGIGYGIFELIKKDSILSKFLYTPKDIENGVMIKKRSFDASASSSSSEFLNKRSECYFRFAAWTREDECKLLHSEKLASELACIKYSADNGRKRVLSKEKMKEEGFKSPNLADAVMMTFCEEEIAKDFALFEKISKKQQHEKPKNSFFKTGNDFLDDYRKSQWGQK